MKSSVAHLAKNILHLGEKLGANEVEVYIDETRLRNIALVKGIETLSSSFITGLGVRIVSEKRVGLSSTSLLTREAGEQTTRRAYSMAKVSPPNNDWVSLAKKTGSIDVEGVFDPEIENLEPENMSEAALEMLGTVSERDSDLFVARGTIQTGVKTTTIVNNYGQELERKESFASTYVTVGSSIPGDKSLGNEAGETHIWRDLNVEGISREASERAITAKKARPIPSTSIPIIWRNKLFANVLSIMFGGTLSADAVQKKRSPWGGKIGSEIASASFTLGDEGSVSFGIGTRQFDDEGVPQRTVSLIKDGILKGYIYDTFTANKDGIESTGNASRTYDSPPRPSPNNLYLSSGKMSLNEILKETRNGLYLQELIGLWLSNPVSGYLGATVANGSLVEDGEVTHPIKGVLISGNFFDIMKNGMDMIGQDVDHSGGSYSPTVRVASMSVTPQ